MCGRIYAKRDRERDVCVGWEGRVQCRIPRKCRILYGVEQHGSNF